MLKFYETDHAPVYKKSPCRVLTVKVDDFLYYPSDSFYATQDQVKILALPTSGPWHKLPEAIELANHVKSPAILATHNGLYNHIGNEVTNMSIKMHLDDPDRQWLFLESGKFVSFESQ